MDSIIYFDICSIPLFLMILFVCYSRKMTKGSANKLFILLVLLSLTSSLADLGIEIVDAMAPLSRAAIIICNISTYVYLIVRNATNVVLVLFLLALTRTTALMRKPLVKAAYFLPYAVILAMLAQNPFTQTAFSVTAEAGYTRGPLMVVFYAIALLYGLAGFVYCIYCRRYLPVNKWTALLGTYLLGHIAVFIQYFRPEILVEMFCTALGEMLIMLSIMRPEERMDSEVGMLSWASYQSDVKNIVLSGERVQIAVIRLQNGSEIRNYLGDHRYNSFISEIANGIRGIKWSHPNSIELYFERPGTIYIITGANESGTENIGEKLLSETREKIRHYEEMGVRFEPQVCLIRCPEDLRNESDIISLGHKFRKPDGRKETVVKAGDIVRSKNFAVEVRIEDILERAIVEDHIEMYYQPICDAASGRFLTAEALARLVDPEYGMIPPGVFIPAAETQGLIIPIGDMVLDHVFRFISEHDLGALGLSCVEINLSVAQCMESVLPEKIRALQEKYGIDSGMISFEITETTFENISDVMMENVEELIRMGYSFALDDYGTGYSSIQRVINIPLKLIKIDKSMLDEISSANGRMILRHTIEMMQSIGKKLVAEGAETAEEVDYLKTVNCDYIQGFYYSRPLPESEFVRFLEEQNLRKQG